MNGYLVIDPWTMPNSPRLRGGSRGGAWSRHRTCGSIMCRGTIRLPTAPLHGLRDKIHACGALDGSVVHAPYPSRDGLSLGILEYVVIHGT